MLARIKELLPGYEAEMVGKENFPPYMNVYDSNEEFCMLTEGEPASMEKCMEDIDDMPPGFDREKKAFWGFGKDGKPAAVLDFLQGYPEKNKLWIGLLMVDGTRHGEGIGSEILRALEQAAGEQGLTALQLGVVEGNQKGLAFWRKQGFSKIRDTVIPREGKADWQVIVMEKQIQGNAE